jgi:lysozyme family protein
MSRKLTTKIALLAVLALGATAVAMPAVATAQKLNPTQGQYDDTLTQIDRGVNPGDPSDPGTSNTGTGTLDETVGPLPFTGFDVIAMAAVALAVAGLGLGLQRAVSRSTH